MPMGRYQEVFFIDNERYDLNYKQEEQAKSFWSKSHLAWIKKKIKTMDKEVRLNFELLLNQYDFLKNTIDEFNEEIETIAKRDRYKKKTEALCCFNLEHYRQCL